MFRLVLLLTAALAGTYGQTTQGLISGRVVDSITGAGVTGAAVTVTGGATALPAIAYANDSGYFALPLLSAGTYHLRVALAGYQPQELYGQELAVAGRLDYDFHLRPLNDVWEQGQTRSVFLPRRAVLPFFGPDVDFSRSGAFQATEGDRASLESTVSSVIDMSEIRRLPLNGRDVYSLLVTQPGAVADAGTARGLGLSFNGQRPSASSFLLDGMENNNYLVSGPLAIVAPEAVEEYRVSTSNFSAEYGRTSGYLANVITRSGTNRWHGTGYLYFKNEALDGNGFQQNAAGIGRAPHKEWQPGVWTGGALLPNRLFVSGAFEYFRLRGAGDPQVYRLPSAGFVPTPGTLSAQLLQQYRAPGAPNSTAATAEVQLAAPTTLNRYLLLPRADYLMRGGRDRFTLRAAIPRVREPDFLWTPYPDFVTPLRQNTFSLAAGAISEVRPNWTNEARAGWSSDDLRFDRPHPEVPSLSSGDSTVLPGSAAFYSYRNRTRNLELLDNVVWTGGRHVVKFGGNLLLRRLDGYLTAGSDGYFGFRNFDAFLRDSPFSFRAALSRSTAALLRSPDYAREYGFTQSALFVQDSFKLSARLVLNFGLRYERLGAPVNTGAVKDSTLQLASAETFAARLAGAKVGAPGAGDQALYDGDAHDFAPRVGFSWSVRPNGGTVVRGSYGIFYDRPFDNLWQNLRNNDVLVPGFALTGTTAVNYLGSQQDLLDSLVSYRFRTYSKDFPGLTLYQPGFRNGYAQSWFVGIRHQITEGLQVEANALGSMGRRLVTTDIVNRAFSLPPEQRTATNATGRFNPAFADVSYRANQGLADYNAFTAAVRYRTARGSLLAAYTLGHSIDNQSEALAGEFFNLSYTRAIAGGAGQGVSAFSRQFDSGGDRGNSDFDQRHNFVFSAYRDLPGHFQISALGAVRSGFPYSVYAPPAFPPPANGQPMLNIRANLSGSPEATGDRSAPGGVRVLNAAAFSAPASGSQGNTGRNAFRGPGLFNIDLSLGRTFAFPTLGEGGRITLRCDAFNFLNHANLNNPDAYLGSPSFGIAAFGRTGFTSGFPALTPFAESARQVQVLLRVEF